MQGSGRGESGDRLSYRVGLLCRIRYLIRNWNMRKPNSPTVTTVVVIIPNFIPQSL